MKLKALEALRHRTGGVHSEVEIPNILKKLRTDHPAAKIDYAWPFDLNRVA